MSVEDERPAEHSVHVMKPQRSSYRPAEHSVHVMKPQRSSYA
jgi:hypothetical protein